MHDTEQWGDKDEVETPCEKKGLKKAIEEFLSSNPEWAILESISESNGLTVLERKPKFSIIIPTCTANIRDCVDKVLKFTSLMDKEIIVVSNGNESSDIDYLYSLRKKITIVNLGKKSGQIIPVNMGAEISRGDFLVLFVLIFRDCFRGYFSGHFICKFH